MLSIIAGCAGVLNAITITFATNCVDKVNAPRTADLMNRAVKPTFILYVGTLVLHYVVNSVDPSTPLAGIYAIAMTIHLIKQPRIEREPLYKNPRERHQVLSKTTSRWLYWLTAPAIIIPIVLMSVAGVFT